MKGTEKPRGKSNPCLALHFTNKTKPKKTNKFYNLENFAYIRQKGPYGNGTPVLNAEHLIGDEPFIYTFADDFIVAEPSRFKQMISMYEQRGCPVLPCIRLSRDEDYDRYGIVAGEDIADGLVRLNTIVEKPGKANAPSNLASVSGYLFTPEIFKYLRQAEQDLPENQEFYAQNGMQLMINDGKELVALEIKNGHYYDTGNKLEYLKTVVDFALKRDDMKDVFMDYLRSVVQ